MKARTKWTYCGKPYLETCGNYCGFVYLVTCHHPDAMGKRYLGRKYMFTKWNTKTLRKQTDWRTYKTSSKYVQAAIAEYGEEHFTFEIICLYKTKGGVVNGEVEAQWAANVLHATDENGNRLYWNEAIGAIRFIAKERWTEEQRQRMLESWTPARRQAAAERLAARNKVATHNQKHKKRHPKLLELATTGKSHKEIATSLEMPLGSVSSALSRLECTPVYSKYDDWQILAVFELADEGLPQAQIGKLLSMPQGTLSAIQRRNTDRYRKIYEDYQAFLSQQA